MAQSFLDNVTRVPQLWTCLKEYILNHRFDATRLEVNPSTGHLIAHESGNLKFFLEE